MGILSTPHVICQAKRADERLRSRLAAAQEVELRLQVRPIFSECSSSCINLLDYGH